VNKAGDTLGTITLRVYAPALAALRDTTALLGRSPHTHRSPRSCRSVTPEATVRRPEVTVAPNLRRTG
jgi:hypothetical protein